MNLRKDKNSSEDVTVFEKKWNLNHILTIIMIFTGLLTGIIGWCFKISNIQSSQQTQIVDIQDKIDIEKADTSKRLDNIEKQNQQIYQYLLDNVHRK